MDRSRGPYLIHAVVCERVLQEQDGVLSLIRVIDRITALTIQYAGPGAPAFSPPPPPASTSVTFALGFRSGDFQGTLPLRLRIDTPSGLKLPEVQLSVLFEGADRGANVILPMQFPLQEEGLHWFTVELGGDAVTRVPLRVIRQTAIQTVPPQIG